MGRTDDKLVESGGTAEFDMSWFVMRTPLLPVDDFLSWTDDATCTGSPSDPLDSFVARRQRLRRGLDRILQRPEVQDALLLASQDLVNALPIWRDSPDSRKGQRAEQALVRYFTRMCTRPTPFGLFSGWSLGCCGTTTALRIEGRESYRHHIQIDSTYVFSLAEMLAGGSEYNTGVRLYPNETIYERAGELHYSAAPHSQGVQLRCVVSSGPLEHCLRTARHGATVQELVSSLCQSRPDISSDQATAFVDALIGGELLKSGWIPPVTGPEPFESLMSSCRAFIGESSVTKALEEVSRLLASADGRSSGDRERYETILAILPEVGTVKRMDRVLRANLIKPASTVTLGPEPLAEIRSALDILQRVGIPNVAHDQSLARFRQEFQERYDRQHVRLTDIFDDETGLDWGRNEERGFSPILDGLSVDGTRPPAARNHAGHHERLRRKLAIAARQQAEEIVIHPSDLDLAMEPWASLPESFHISGIIEAASEEDCRNGRFRIILGGISGPPGTRVLGRYCHSDPELCARVKSSLRAEEQLRPDAIFAEIAYAPPGSLRNVVVRPNLREYEIPYLGRSGVALDKQILPADLWVSVSGERVTLYSQRLRREVVPRLTSAHAYHGPANPRLYRFLCSIGRARLPGQGFWEADEKQVYMPRVVFGRVVLSRARWRIDVSDLSDVMAATGAEQFDAIQDLRTRMRWPRYIGFIDFENQLIIDLDNPLSTAAVVPLLRGRTTPALFVEWLPGPGLHCARGPEGRFVHEIVLPVTRTRSREERGLNTSAAQSALVVSAHSRSFWPGSEWSYVKLYAGQLALDRILRDVVRPLVTAWTASGIADRWFFIRYADPESHIRLRVRTPGGRGLTRIVDDVNGALASREAGRLVRRRQYDSYEREVERYGGIEAMELAESIFQADSEAVLEILSMQAGRDARRRWMLAFEGVDSLLDDLALSCAEKLTVIKARKNGLWRQLDCPPILRRQLANRYRRERPHLEILLGASPDRPDEPRSAFVRRSEELRSLGGRLAELERSRRLSVHRLAVCESYVHMHANRMLAVDSVAQELVISDFLQQLYSAKLAMDRRNALPLRGV